MVIMMSDSLHKLNNFKKHLKSHLLKIVYLRIWLFWYEALLRQLVLITALISSSLCLLTYYVSVVQSDVTGECETKYVISSDVNMTSAGRPPAMLVSTIRNFDKCVKKPYHITGLFAGVYVQRNEKVNNFYLSVVKYRLYWRSCRFDTRWSGKHSTGLDIWEQRPVLSLPPSRLTFNQTETWFAHHG